jgi:uncharacterized protein (DUF58 family)
MPTPLLDPAFLKKLETLTLRSRRRPIHTGVHGERRSRALGRGVEFADYRSYQSGDDYRHIDWSIYSRLDRLFVRLFSEDEDVNVHLFVDASPSMVWGVPSKLDYAVRIAAAIGYVALTNLDRVGAAAFGDHLHRLLPPQRSRGHVFRLFEFLSAVGSPPDGASSLRQAMRDYIHQTTRRGLLVIISDLLYPDGYEEGLALSRYHRFDPIIVHVLSEDELTPVVRGDARLIDAETNQTVDVSVDGPALEAYAQTRDSYFHDLEAFCLRHEIDYIRTTTSIPVEDLILRYLRIGGLVQ